MSGAPITASVRPSLTIGIEEEYQTIDPDTRDPPIPHPRDLRNPRAIYESFKKAKYVKMLDPTKEMYPGASRR